MKSGDVEVSLEAFDPPLSCIGGSTATHASHPHQSPCVHRFFISMDHYTSSPDTTFSGLAETCMSSVTARNLVCFFFFMFAHFSFLTRDKRKKGC